jgi:hypothetical protein
MTGASVNRIFAARSFARYRMAMTHRLYEPA